MPERIQRRRTKGWRMPPGAIYVGRPTKWGNPFQLLNEGGWPLIIGPGDSNPCLDEKLTWEGAHRRIVELFRAWVLEWPSWRRSQISDLLRGRDLACWCPIISHGNYIPCHADVLLSLANDIPIDEVIRENTRRPEGQAVR